MDGAGVYIGYSILHPSAPNSQSQTMPFTKFLLQNMLDAALATVERNLEMLNRLDSATGDGDHGTAILAAMKAAAAGAKKDGNLASTLEVVGWDIMGGTSGSTSALTGSFFVGMAGAVSGEELDADQVIDLFEAGLANVRVSTKAQVGDKTLMDALIPAVEAMKAKKGSGASLKDVFQAAAQAARRGVESTKDLVAKHGRAKNLGERSRGHLDAGAESTALIYESYAEVVSSDAS